MLYENTIAATATSSANGSISVIRVSGNEAFAAVSNIFCDGKGKRIDLSKYETHTIHYGFICCLLYTSPSPRDPKTSRMPSSA